VAQNEINIKVKISDDGSLSLVSQKAEQAAKSTEKLADSRNRYSKGEKGVAGATSNSTKAFSKMNQAMGGGLVPAYATLAANVFALSAAFGVLRRAAQVEQLEQGISTLGAASGLAMSTLSKGLQESTGHALSLEEAMRSTAMITSAGLDPTMINKFGEAAKNASIALGRNAQDSLERFTRGVTKLEPELLDELGIFVKLDEAYESYANKLDKNVTQLTSFEKRQAFANATLDEASQKFGAIGDVDANPYDKLAAAFADVSKSFLKVANSGIVPFLTLLLENTGLLVSAVLLFGSTISGKIVGSLGDYAEGAANAAKFQKDLTQSNIGSLNAANRSSKSLTNLTEALAAGTENEELFESAIRGQEMSLVSNAKFLKQGAEGQEEYNKRKKTSARISGEIRKAQLASTLATAQNSQAEAFAALQTGNYALAKEKLKLSFATLNGAMKVATKQTTLLSRALAVGKVAALMASGAFRVAGAAVSMLMGPVGIAIAVFTTLYEVAKGIFNFFKSKETKALEEVVSSAADTAKELDKNFQEINLSLAENSKIINTVTQRYEALGNATSQTLEVLRKMEATDATGNIKEQVKYLNDRAEVSTSIAAALREAGIVKINTRNLEKAKGTLEELVLQGQQTSSIKEAFKNLNDETTEYFNTLSKSTPVDGMADSLRALMNSLAGTNDIKDITKIINEGIGQSGRLRQMFDEAEGNSQKEKLRLLTETITTEQKRIRIGKDILASATSEVKIKKGLNILSEEGVRAVLEMEKKLLETKMSQIDIAIAFQQRQRESAKDAEQDQQIAAEITRLTNEKAELFVKIKSDAEENLVVQSQILKNLQEQQKAEKMILDFAAKDLSLLEGKQQLEMSSLRRAAELKALSEQRSVSAAEEVALANQEAQNLVDSETQRIAIRTQTINMEYDLLAAQFELEKMRLETLLANEQLSKKDYDRILGNKGTASTEDPTITTGGSGILGALSGLEGQRSRALEQATAIEKDKTKEGSLTAAQALATLNEEERATAKAFVDQQSQILRENGEYERAVGLERVFNEMEILRLKELSGETSDANARAEIERKITELKQKNVSLERESLGLNANEANSIALEQARIDLLRERGTVQEAISAQEALNNSQIATLQKELGSEVTTLERKLEIEREIAALKQGNVGLTQEQIGIAGETAMRMGAPEGMTGAMTGIAQDKADPEGVMNQGTNSEKFAFLKKQTEGFMSDLSQLSPEGALMSSIAQGALQMGESFSNVFTEIGDKGLTVQTAMQAVGATISAIGAMQQAKANQAVSAIDKEIAAEKKKDGKSKESIAKIKALEAKKEKIKRKAFEQDKKMKIAGVIMATAQAAIQAASAPPGLPFTAPNVAMAIAMGAAQLAAVASTSYQGGGSVSSAGGTSAPTQIKVGGDRRSTTDLAKSQGAGGELAYFRGAQGIGGPENFRPAASGMKYRANGGNTAFMVGEQGPEMFIPERPGTIVPSDETPQLGTPINANINITALDADGVEDILMNQRGNIIGMLRDAANANGETFLESVSVQEY